jgi:hypothetical protein
MRKTRKELQTASLRVFLSSLGESLPRIYQKRVSYLYLPKADKKRKGGVGSIKRCRT